MKQKIRKIENELIQIINEKNFKKIHILMIFLLVCMFTIVVMLQGIKGDCPVGKMTYFWNNETSNVKGLNIPNCGYFVDTRGKNIEQIKGTNYHEACHELIRREPEHFIEKYCS